MQQNLLARLEPGEFEQVQPRRGIDLRNGRRLVQRKTFRDRQHVSPIDHHFFGHRPARQQRTDAVSDHPGRTRTDFGDHAGALQTQCLSDSRWRRILAFALQQIGTIQTCRSHFDTYLPHIKGRTRLLDPFHMSFNALQCLHGASIVSPD